MKNGGVWRRLAGSLLGTRQIYLCGAVRYPVILTFPAFLPRTTPFLLTVAIFVLEDFHFGLRFAPSIFRVIILLTYTVAVFLLIFGAADTGIADNDRHKSVKNIITILLIFFVFIFLIPFFLLFLYNVNMQEFGDKKNSVRYAFPGMATVKITISLKTRKILQFHKFII